MSHFVRGDCVIGRLLQGPVAALLPIISVAFIYRTEGEDTEYSEQPWR
jgi:hypothetical protein